MKAELPDKVIFLSKGCFSANTLLLSNIKVQREVINYSMTI